MPHKKTRKKSKNKEKYLGSVRIPLSERAGYVIDSDNNRYKRKPKYKKDYLDQE